MKSRLEYLKQIKGRYLKADKKEKSKILDEYCQSTKHNRKYIIRRLSAKIDLSKPKIVKLRKTRYHYTADDIDYLFKVWELLDYPCGQRLAPILNEILDKLEKFKELNIPKTIAKKLRKISSSTIDARLKPYRIKLRRKILGTTKPGNLIKKQIPIRTVSWDEKRLGYCELDTVAHFGESAKGDFICSLTLTDLLTGWTENEAFMGKAQSRIKIALENIQKRLPFKLKGIDPDNGSEFINWQLYNYCQSKKIEFTRGRPYKKNDNAHVEQKNWTHVRKIFGYQRLESIERQKIMNDLYRNELGLFQNFFQPNIKLFDKKRIGKNKEKIKRVYEKAKTPYQRLLECKKINVKKLKSIYDKLNPAEIKRKIQEKLKYF